MNDAPGKSPLSADEIKRLNKEYTLFSWSAQGALDPMAISHAKGAWFWDADGNKYLDFASQLISVNLGHQHPKVIEAMKAQIDTLMFAQPAFATEPRGRLGKRLSEISGLKKAFFTLGGAEAIENAIKVARMYTGRHKIVSRYRSYHGGTAAAMTVSGDSRRWPMEPGIPGVVRVLDPHCYRCPFGREVSTCHRECVSHIEEVLQYEGPHNVAAILVETITGSNGVLIPPDDYLPKLRAICDKYGILLICDEVMAGFGRTGKWFAFQHFDVMPDLVTCAKGLTSSYVPMGALLVSEKIAAHFDKNVLWGGLTYSSHPVSCATALAVLDAYEEDHIFENVQHLEGVLTAELNAMKARHPSVGDVRCKGLFSIIELVKNRQTKEELSPLYGPQTEPMLKVAKAIKAGGVSTFVRFNWVMVTPPLCITEAELRQGLQVIDQALYEADAYVS